MIVYNTTFRLLLAAFLLCIWGILASLKPGIFLSPGIYYSWVISIPTIVLLSAALLPLLIAGELDLSFTAQMCLCSYIFSSLCNAGFNVFLALFGTISCAFICAFLNSFLVLFMKINTIVATLGMQFVYAGFATSLAKGLPISLELTDSAGFKLVKFALCGRLFGFLPMQALWAVALMAILAFVLFKTTFGEGIMFVGDDEKSARMLGFSPEKIKFAAFLNCALLSSLAGMIQSLEYGNWWPSLGEAYLLYIFAAIFIGGTSLKGGMGTVFGTFIGCIIIGILESCLVILQIPSYSQRLCQGLFIILPVCFYQLAPNLVLLPNCLRDFPKDFKRLLRKGS